MEKLELVRREAIKAAEAQNAVANAYIAGFEAGKAQAATQGPENRNFTIEEVTRCKAIFSRGKITCHF